MGKTCSKKLIGKLFSLLREKIKNDMHKIWNNNTKNGYPAFKIDENEFIWNYLMDVWNN